MTDPVVVDGRGRRLMSILYVVAAGYVGYAALLFVMQRSMIFPGASMALGAMSSAPEDAEVVWLGAEDDKTEAWYFGPVPPDSVEADSAATLVFAHGNAELIDHWVVEARSLARAGMGVLLVEYPGYGRSAGRPSRESVRAAFRAAYDWLARKPEVDPMRIVGFGRSLGGGAISDLSRDRALAALVFQSTFTSAADLSRRYLVPSALLRDRFDNVGAVADFDGPVLVVHGERDEVVPYTHGVRLARAREGVRLITLACGHNDCPPDWDAFRTELMEFLREAGVTRH